jgi:predicted transcriptional regulator
MATAQAATITTRMMSNMDAIFSIRPQYVEAIFRGDKTVELRTRIPSKPVNKIWIYCTSPVKKIVGYFNPGEPVQYLQYNDHYRFRGITALLGESPGYPKNDLQILKNLMGDKYWHAIPITNLVKLDTPFEPKIFTNWHAPQSWQYSTSSREGILNNYLDLEYMRRQAKHHV